MWPWMGEKWGPPGDENFLYLYGSHLSNLVVLLFHSFVRCYYWQKLSEEYVVFLCVISYKRDCKKLQIACLQL